MGSKSSSKTSSTNTTKDLTTTNADSRVAEGDGDIGGNINVNFSDISTTRQGGNALDLTGIGGGNGDPQGSGNIISNITTSDFGALDTASEIAENAFSFSQGTVTQLGNTVASTVATLREVAEDAVGVAESAARDESARTTQLAIVAAGLVGVFFILRGPLSKVFK